MNTEIRKIYKKLGLDSNVYSGPGGEDYKKFKLKRFKDRLKISLCLYESCLQMRSMATAIQKLSAEEILQLKISHTPRELLTILLRWERGEIVFISKENRIQLVVEYQGAEYDFIEFLKPFRKKCLKQEEKHRVKNLLCLRTLETLIQEGKVILE